jgi:competence protein ComEA
VPAKPAATTAPAATEPATAPPETVPLAAPAPAPAPASGGGSSIGAIAIAAAVLIAVIGLNVAIVALRRRRRPPAAVEAEFLNTATVRELVQVPGIGPRLAQRILAYREERGALRSVEELRGLPGMNEARLAGMRSAARDEAFSS